VKGIKQTLMVIMLAFLAISTAACAAESQPRTSMDTHHTTLWQLIETLIDHPSFTLDTIGQAIPVEFTERGNNGSFSFYRGGPLRLVDQVVIKTATLAIRHESGVSRLIGLDLSPDSVCVTRRELYTHYPNAKIIGHPRGGSLDEMTTWAVRPSWGEIVFGFKERNPNCLSHVGIDRIEANRPQPK